jgi:SPX domain protein involved in polyphosphate accumulation
MGYDLVRDRTEIKYVLSSEEGRDLLERLRSVRPGPEFERQDGWVTTVYFDRPDLLLTRRAIGSPSANLKVRLREYLTVQDQPKSPFIWVELKERDRQVSRKLRFQLHKRLVRHFLSGEVDLGIILTCQDRAPGEAVEAVRRIAEVAQGRLVPVGAVRYRRASLEDRAHEARLTVDRGITYHRERVDLYEVWGALNREAAGPAAWEEPGTVAELKYRGEDAPRWCGALLAGAAPADYSKFLVLSQRSASEASVA